jgi:putative transposase
MAGIHQLLFWKREFHGFFFAHLFTPIQTISSNALKQQPKVKRFVGTSLNALLSQLWLALIAYLLLSYLKSKSRFGWSLYTLCAILQSNLFSLGNLWDWLNTPFHAKSLSPPDMLELKVKFG